MDIFTGEIIAMHSSPSFNPNLFVYGISQKEWDDIRLDKLKPLINKTIWSISFNFKFPYFKTNSIA